MYSYIFLFSGITIVFYLLKQISANNDNSSSDRKKRDTSSEEKYFRRKVCYFLSCFNFYKHFISIQNADDHHPKVHARRLSPPWGNLFEKKENPNKNGPVIKKFRNLVYQSFFETCLTNSSGKFSIPCTSLSI